MSISADLKPYVGMPVGGGERAVSVEIERRLRLARENAQRINTEDDSRDGLEMVPIRQRARITRYMKLGWR